MTEQLALRELKIKRGSLKSTLKRFTTYLNNVDDSVLTSEIKGRLAKLDPVLEQFDNIQTQIEIQENTDCQEIEREEFENSYFKLIGRLEQLIISSSSNSQGTSNNIRGHKTSDEILESNIKLPTINLPNFSGAYTEWFPFYDTFKSLIHDNTKISDIQKFHYLRSSLQGEAAGVIECLEISAENYKEAWEMLKGRYDNKRLIVQNHIRAIHELPVALKESQSALRTILDGILKHVRALKALSRPTDSWDDLLIYLIVEKLDSITTREWENSLTSYELPTFKAIIDFLTHKCQTLESIGKNYTSSQSVKNNHTQNKKIASHVSTNKLLCQICNDDHPIFRCTKFLNFSVDQRIAELKAKRLCLNCLKPNHYASECQTGSCKTCKRKHNSLVHKEQIKQTAKPVVSTHSSIIQDSHVLLSTARIKIYDSKGKSHLCCALLDSGSQSNFITESLAKKLNLSRKSFHMLITGINQSSTVVSQSVQVKIQSRFNAFEANLNCLLLKTITGNIPAVTIPKTQISFPNSIKLADPDFNVSKGIDLLIGAELFYRLLCIGQIKSSLNQPVLQKNLLGWIISGKTSANTSSSLTSVCNISLSENLTRLDKTLSKFWEIESCANKSRFTQEERACEEHFSRTFKRSEEGRFIVSLPFKGDPKELGNSRDQALKRFYSLENKLNKKPEIKAQYVEFMDEYLQLGHMKEIGNPNLQNDSSGYYLPHHAVIKESSLTTKLRVIFDGSCKTTTGVSLNDLLMLGPKLQQDLFSIVTRFRTFKYVLTADIISRGLPPQLLAECNIWWKGPVWLQEEPSKWPTSIEASDIEYISETRNVSMLSAITQSDTSIFFKYSNFSRLIRIVAYCLCFKDNVLARIKGDFTKIRTDSLNSSDLNSATNALVIAVQGSAFPEDLIQLNKHGKVHIRSNLLCLNPFLDENGIIRVGGRLRNSNLPYDERHQILLPSKHPFTELMISHEHRKQLHGGVQTTISAIRSRYWLLSARNTIKAVLRKCLICFRAKPSNVKHIMGDLPAERSRQSRPFQNVGVDYFGPLYVREGLRKSKVTRKAYGAVFVCLATKAVHNSLSYFPILWLLLNLIFLQ